MGFDDIKKKAQEFVGGHGDKIEQGLDKAGKFAKDKFGHEDKVDKALGKAKGFIDGAGGGQGGQRRS
ncbi:MAG: antitoxin [Sciscionella sp.]